MAEQLETEDQIDLKQAALTILHKWPIIVVAAIVCGIAAYVYSNWFMTPIYSTNVKFYVNNQQGVADSIKVQSSDVATSSTLVHGYVAMIKTDRVLEEVAMNTGLGYSAAQIGSMIDAAGIENTPIFVVTVRNSDPVKAQTIANVVADISPSLIQEIVKGSSVEIIDRAKLPTRPVSPNVKRITLIGFFAGFALSIALI
ncbi:MAG: YveK family protein, partial [Clostridia bacterium]